MHMLTQACFKTAGTCPVDRVTICWVTVNAWEDVRRGGLGGGDGGLGCRELVAEALKESREVSIHKR